MPILNLPAPRRAHLRAFGLIQGIYGALLVTIAGEISGLGVNKLLASLIGLLIAAATYLWPQIITRFYKLWMISAAGYSRLAQKFLLRICYYFVIVPAGLGRSPVTGTPPKSGWSARASFSPMTYDSPYDEQFPGCERSGVAGYYPGWSARSGNLWTLGLLPFLILIASLDDKPAERYSGHIYTLF